MIAGIDHEVQIASFLAKSSPRIEPRTDMQLLDHIVWHTLSGAHAKFSTGTNDARRYARGFSTIVGFADAVHPNFAALADYCESGEHFYCDGWSGVAPSGWRIDAESTMFKMVWQGALPDAEHDAPRAVRLETKHASQAVDLAALTHPGPFGPRTIELGEYFGFFEGPMLIAMAGERMHAGSLREISGVCTHPDFQDRGYAHRLMRRLISRQIQRNETPFLHVMRGNTVARAIYQRMGFHDYRESVVRVVSLS